MRRSTTKIPAELPPAVTPPGVPGPAPEDLAKLHPQLRGLATPLTRLRLDPANARRHGKRNLEAVCASLERWGQRLPLIARRNGTIIAGNARLAGMARLGWTWAAVLFVDDDDASAAAFAIADNRTADLAEWDSEQLAATLEKLLEEDRLVLDSVGFTREELQGLLEETKPDDEEEEPKGPPRARLLERLLRETADGIRASLERFRSLEEIAPRLEALAGRIDDAIGPPEPSAAPRRRRR